MPEEISLEKITELLLEFLDGLDKPERIEAIDTLIHRLNFERRVTTLTEKEAEHMMNEGLSPAQKEKLDEAKAKGNQSKYDELINAYARATYFRRMAWVAYLNDGGEKPFSCPDPEDK